MPYLEKIMSQANRETTPGKPPLVRSNQETLQTALVPVQRKQTLGLKQEGGQQTDRSSAYAQQRRDNSNPSKGVSQAVSIHNRSEHRGNAQGKPPAPTSKRASNLIGRGAPLELTE